MGDRPDTWETYAYRWAAIESLSGREAEVARQLDARVTCSIRFRWVPELTAEHRILWTDNHDTAHKYQIHSVQTWDERAAETVGTVGHAALEAKVYIDGQAIIGVRCGHARQLLLGLRAAHQIQLGGHRGVHRCGPPPPVSPVATWPQGYSSASRSIPASSSVCSSSFSARYIFHSSIIGWSDRWISICQCPK
jgi:head-tail adaptor